MKLFCRRAATNFATPNQILGSLEARVMDVLWERGESSVRDVFEKMDRPLAYTTVMTTLDRLFKKGLLERYKIGRAFVYSPVLNREEWEYRRAEGLIAAFLDGPQPSPGLLVSSLLDAIGQEDVALLSELEQKIRRRRKELSGKGRS
ncbi:MAG TPA: BlaI/MecI/CopY family transcriptional regulator [Candidatus Acidoferrales bacterium]|nr:BlaI/MecI/CopY family transcriptional regulator [Candidatus Acidoferrales bacterium]